MNMVCMLAPMQADIQDINNHVEFLAASRDIDAEGLQHIDFGDFLALYINHRPLFPVTQDDVVAAFKDLGAKGNPGELPPLLCCLSPE